MSTCFMTADPPVFHDLITWTVILVCQLGCTRQQGRRRSKYFESGSRLIGIIDALISPHLVQGILLLLICHGRSIHSRIQCKRIIQVKFRHIGTGIDFSILGVQYQN